MSRKKSTFKNIDSMPTHIIREVLDSPNCTTTDGRDYWDIKEELEALYWQRMNAQTEKLIADYDRTEKARIKELAASHKRKGK